MRCHPDRIEVVARVVGRGTLATVQLLGGHAVSADGACGLFRSSIEFASTFDPAVTEPVQVVRPPSVAATLGVIGDGAPGRQHGGFAPPPIGDVAAPAAALSRQDRYDEWLERLATHHVVPGTVVVDDRWQLAYGTGEPDPAKWPDLRAWIARRHASGQCVLLWWKAWDPDGLEPGECLRTPAGVPVAADPGSDAYRAHLTAIITRLLSPDGLDANGLKVDYLQRTPAGHSLRVADDRTDVPWGTAALHALLDTIYRAAKAAKPDALIVAHRPHPAFADVTDMVRLNDICVRDPAGEPVPPAEQLRFRHAVACNAMPHHLVDTDQWPIGDRAGWREYVAEQARLGVPSLYYAERLHHPTYGEFAERIERAGDDLGPDDLALVAQVWRAYRGARADGRPNAPRAG